MIETAVEMLFAERPAAEVISWLSKTFVDDARQEEQRERPLSSLSSTFTRVRNAVLGGNRRANNYDPSALAALAEESPEISRFLSAALPEQLQIQRAHAAAPSWGDDAERCLRELQLLPKSMTDFKLTREQCLELRANREAAQFRKNECLIVIENTADLLSTVELLLASATPNMENARLILPLLLASGRRLTEVCSPRSSFGPVEGHPTYCQFDGALKKKSSANTGGRIPLLVPYTTFAHALTAFRTRQRAVSADKRRAKTSIDSLTNLQIKSRYGHGVNLALEHAGAFLPLPMYPCLRTGEPRRCHAHDLRAIYAKMAYKLYQCDDTFNRTACRVLLHEALNESLSYANVRLRGLDEKIGSFGPLLVC